MNRVTETNSCYIADSCGKNLKLNPYLASASKWQMGFNSVFKGLADLITICGDIARGNVLA